MACAARRDAEWGTGKGERRHCRAGPADRERKEGEERLAGLLVLGREGKWASAQQKGKKILSFSDLVLDLNLNIWRRNLREF